MQLARYAVPMSSDLREYSEEKFLYPFLIDRIRLVNSMAFRRLEYKTQVFVNHTGDHYRTRLTHSLEVAQVASIISRALMLNDDLVETIALAHDIGHPPFGHSGEEGLNDAAKSYGGFNHNLQAIKIITKLENAYPTFSGLNMTQATIEGLIKHNGPIQNIENLANNHIINQISDKLSINVKTFGTMEAQVASLADDITYCSHDIDDGIRAKMFTIDDIGNDIHIIGEIKEKVFSEYHNLNYSIQVKEIIRRIKDYMINDLIATTQTNLKYHKIQTQDDIQNADTMIVSFSNEGGIIKDNIKKFLFQNLYKNYKVNRISIKTKKITSCLFNTFLENPSCMPTEWQNKMKNKEDFEVIIDYISGMTDRYAIQEYGKLFNCENL